MKKKSNKNIINHLLCNSPDNQYFFKNTKEQGYLIDINKLENQPIYAKDNIFLSLAADCEYTQTLSISPKHITLELLESNPNRLLVQADIIDQVLAQEGLTGINHLSKTKRLSVKSATLDKLNKVKAARTLQLTTQFKHVLYNDAEILINPQILPIIKKHVTNEKYNYPPYSSLGCHFIDYLKLKGFKDFDIEQTDNIEKLKKFKTCTLKIFGYFMIADLCKMFGGEYLKDIVEAIKKGKLTLKRRLAASGYQKAWYTNWIISFNNLQYRLAIEFVDLGGIHGIESLEKVIENLGMDTSEKNLLNDIKDNILLSMIKRPEEFYRYSIGDLNLYEVLEKHNELLRSIYKSLDVESQFKESKLTTGAYTNDLQEIVLLKKLNYSKQELQEFVDDYNANHNKPKKELDVRHLLKPNTYTASPQYLKSYVNVNLGKDGENDIDYKKHIGSKTPGGRCNPNRLITTSISSPDIAICDIDIAGAYSTVYNSLNYYFGHPVIRSFNKHKVTLRQFLKYSEELGKRNYKMMVETKEPLNIEQDLFYSWTNLTFKREEIKTSSLDSDFQHLLNSISKNEEYQTLQSVDLDSTNSDIFTRELHNTTLTWDDIDCIMTELKKEQREELLDKLYMIVAIYYPNSMECKSIEEYKEKTKQQKIDGRNKYNHNINHSKIDNKALGKSHYWVGINYGEMIGETIKIARAKYKTENRSLATLFKLVGNTLYGINVSQYFIASNIVLAANITSMCRIGMWYIEKGVNIHQTITDGGIFDLNKVPHLIYKSIDTTKLVRAYQFTDRELANNDKWNTRPITCDGNKITFDPNKGWLLDGIYYSKENYKRLYSEINKITMQHVQNIFHNNSLLNHIYKHVRTDSKDNPTYEDKKGLFEFEVKALTNEASFHAAANYYYNDYNENKDKLKMRGYESKKSVIAFSLDKNNNLVPDENYYKETTVIEMFLKNIKDKPQAVQILPPFIKPSLLKLNQFKKQYKKTYQYSYLLPGDETYKIVTIPIFTMRFKFQTLKQKEMWLSFVTKLKNRYGGLSMEIFFMNEDGTCNFKKMIMETDKYISNSVIDPREIYDPHRHLYRDYKNPFILKRTELVRQLKNRLRLITVGPSQYCKEKKF
jgi:hypothetical protein